MSLSLTDRETRLRQTTRDFVDELIPWEVEAEMNHGELPSDVSRGHHERAAELGDRAWRDLLERHHAAVRRELRALDRHLPAGELQTLERRLLTLQAQHRENYRIGNLNSRARIAEAKAALDGEAGL